MKFFGLFKERSIEEELESTDEKLRKSEKSRNELLRRRNRWYQFARRIFIILIAMNSILILMAQFLTMDWCYYVQGKRLYLATIFMCCLNYLFYYGMKRFINWYYSFMISSIDKQIELLDENILKLLSKAMESEPYNKTKELLNKYSRRKFDEIDERIKENVQIKHDPNKKPNEQSDDKNTSSSSPILPTTSHDNDVVDDEMITEKNDENETSEKEIVNMKLQHLEEVTSTNESKNPMPVNRSVFEKFVDFLIGDGPSNKYALVCERCHFHNGLAFPEEFPTLEYRCVNCKFMNMGKSRVRKSDDLTISDHPVDNGEIIDPLTFNNTMTTLRKRNISHGQSTSNITAPSDKERIPSSVASSSTNSKNDNDSDIEIIAHHL
ncbi:hypothetical protein SNEBB_009638 [Seison nebaliae]|nr:hypothetical protein SNEBB_009638 [Seison nebaliae]